MNCIVALFFVLFFQKNGFWYWFLAQPDDLEALHTMWPTLYFKVWGRYVNAVMLDFGTAEPSKCSCFFASISLACCLSTCVHMFVWACVWVYPCIIHKHKQTLLWGHQRSAPCNLSVLSHRAERWQRPKALPYCMGFPWHTHTHTPPKQNIHNTTP